MILRLIGKVGVHGREAGDMAEMRAEESSVRSLSLMRATDNPA